MRSPSSASEQPPIGTAHAAPAHPPPRDCTPALTARGRYEPALRAYNLALAEDALEPALSEHCRAAARRLLASLGRSDEAAAFA